MKKIEAIIKPFKLDEAIRIRADEISQEAI
jgi:nitrogen regulatory protein PII